MPELPIIPFASAHAWEDWLEANHATSDGLWLKIAKKDSGRASVNYQEALTLALCFGWIDGQRNKFDETYFLQKFTPRRKKSKWSKINRDKVIALTEQGQMRPAGLREVEKAKADGRWDAAYDSQRNITVPDDLQALLDANPAAQAFFDQLNSINRYAILYRLLDAKKPETRQKRLAQFIDMLNEGRKIYG